MELLYSPSILLWGPVIKEVCILKGNLNAFWMFQISSSVSNPESSEGRK